MAENSFEFVINATANSLALYYIKDIGAMYSTYTAAGVVSRERQNDGVHRSGQWLNWTVIDLDSSWSGQWIWIFKNMNEITNKYL